MFIKCMKYLCLGIIFTLSAIPLASAQLPYEQWVAFFDGQYTGNSLAIDTDGSVYVTGIDNNERACVTIKYDNSGNQLWVARKEGYGCGSLAVDENGYVYVSASSSSLGCGAIKYDTYGNELWSAGYKVPNNEHCEGRDLALDIDGNVYITGAYYYRDPLDLSGDHITSYDYATLKYDADGNQLWLTRYNGLANDYDYPTSLAVDIDGNVYVTGTSVSKKWITSGWATIKYDTFGNQLWVARYYGSANDVGQAQALAVDNDGYVYVTGYTHNVNTGKDYATIKYDTLGNEEWVSHYSGGSDSYEEVAYALAVDDEGNVFVTGDSGDGYSTIKYDRLGNELWVSHYTGMPTFGSLRTHAVALDADGNVYITALSDDWDLSYGVIIKYDTFGNEIWITGYDKPNLIFAPALAIDEIGQVYVTCSDLSDNKGGPIITIKYISDADGDGVADKVDICPNDNATGLDADKDGCVDSFIGLIEFIHSLADKGQIKEETADRLVSRVRSAELSATSGHTYAAIVKLRLLKIRIEAQSGTGIPEDTADLLISYTDNLISQLVSELQPGGNSNASADIDQDGDVDARDLSRIIEVYGLDENDTNFDPLCDFVTDGIIDIKDIEAWVPYFGRTDCPCQM